MYHGWNDPAISPLISIKLYKDAVAANGGEKATANSIRLFLLPGKGHCGNPFNQMSVITEWVEHGKSPDQVLVTYPAVDAPDNAWPVRARPVCTYPKVARYKGSGSPNVSTSFACVASGAES